MNPVGMTAMTPQQQQAYMQQQQLQQQQLQQQQMIQQQQQVRGFRCFRNEASLVTDVAGEVSVCFEHVV
jgi:hypothetical protein